MYAKPKENYRLLGTDIRLNKSKWYPVTLATNIPPLSNGKKQYFVDALLLTEDEIIIKGVTH